MRREVSVVIPTYNGERYLAAAIESVWHQTHRPAELLIVDDRSRDQTASFAQRLARESPVPMRVLEMPTNSGGPSGPMNLGVEEAATEIVTFLDQDDIMRPRKVELVSAAFDCAPPRMGLVFGRSGFMKADGEMQVPPPGWYDVYPHEGALFGPEDLFRSLLLHGYRFGGAGGTAVSKSAWQDLGGFNTKLSICWDVDFALRIAVRGWSARYVPQEVFVHRHHDTNLKRAENGARCICEETESLLDIWEMSASSMAGERELLREVLLRRVASSGYWERRRGRYRAAQRCHWFSFRHGGQYVAPIVGTVKIGAQYFLDQFRRRP